MAKNPYLKPLAVVSALVSTSSAVSAGTNLLVGNYGRAAGQTIASAGWAYEAIRAARGRLPDGRGFGLAAGAFGAMSLDNLFDISGNGVNTFQGFIDLVSGGGAGVTYLMLRRLNYHRKSPEVEAAYERVKGSHPKIRSIQNELAMEIYGRPAELKPARVVSSGWQHFFRGDVLVTSAGPTDTIALDSCLLKDKLRLTLDQRVLAHIANAEGARTANYIAAHHGYGGRLWDYEFTAVEAVGVIFGERSLQALGQPAAPRRLKVNYSLLQTNKEIKGALLNPYGAGKVLCGRA